MRRHTWTATLVFLVLGTAGAGATDYNITDTERAACTGDAVRFCSHTYPDQRALLSCMKQNVASLSTGCATTFKAGLRRRHLI